MSNCIVAVSESDPNVASQWSNISDIPEGVVVGSSEIAGFDYDGNQFFGKAIIPEADCEEVKIILLYRHETGSVLVGQVKPKGLTQEEENVCIDLTDLCYKPKTECSSSPASNAKPEAREIDPCKEYKRLQAKLVDVCEGQVVSVKKGDRQITYSKANIPDLRALIRHYRDECNKCNPCGNSDFRCASLYF